MEKVRLSLFTDNMRDYIENLSNLPKKLLKLANLFTNITGDKIYTLKLILFLLLPIINWKLRCFF